MQRVTSFSKSVRSLTSSRMGNIISSEKFSPPSTPVILALLGLEGPERDLFIKEVTGTDLVRDQNTENGAKASIFKGTLANRNIWLVDCPSMSVPDREFLEAVKTTILKDYTGSKGAVDGVVYFHDITDTNVKEQAARNLALFAKLQRPGQDNVMIVTTQWDRDQPSEEGTRIENDVKDAYGCASPSEVVNVRQIHGSSGEESNYVDIARELLATITISARIGNDQLAKMSLQDLIAIVMDKENEVMDLRARLQTHTREIESTGAELKQAQHTIDSLRDELQRQQAEFSSEKQSMVQELENAQTTVNHLRVDLQKNHDETFSEITRLQKRFSSDKTTLEDKIRQLEGKISTVVLTGRVYTPDETLSSTTASELNELDARGEFPLYKAAAAGHYDDVKRMLEQGADPSMQTWYKWTALHWAVNNGHKDVIELLLSHGADINALSDTGKRPLSMARSDDIRQLLIEREAQE